jgi:2-methylisocitrate lyase-like PEP mutase family enzyme
MTEQAQKARLFLALHHGERPLLLPNPWDRGSAKLLTSLGFQALATTSSGYAATLGRLDGSVTREEAVEHAASIVEVTDLPVSADLENAFADEPAGVAGTLRLALEAGLAGCSVEDFTAHDDAPIYDVGLAAERVAAAAEVAHGGPVHLVLTARAENYLRGRQDLADTISRLQLRARGHDTRGWPRHDTRRPLGAPQRRPGYSDALAGAGVTGHGPAGPSHPPRSTA